MKTVGIICEYNPFHLGHLRQLNLIKEKFGEDTAIICVMSGNYVQRGAPAMWDKFTRAKAAVACGADLVLELPVTKVLQSAEGFARGGVEILTRLGIVDTLCFGAECGDADVLMELAGKLDHPDCKAALQEHLASGLSYAAARQLAADDKNGLLSSPNNILGVEYCRALRHYQSPISIFAVQRNGDYHASEADTNEPSATAVRNCFPSGNWKKLIPQAAANILENAPWYEAKYGERAMLARLRALTDEEWEFCAHGSEGLWSKAMKAARSEHSLEQIPAAIKSKRYPMTRIHRLLLCAYLGISKSDLLAPLHYTRLLACSENGRRLLRQIKTQSDLPVINPGETPSQREYYRLETRASDLFSLFCAQNTTLCATEQRARINL